MDNEIHYNGDGSIVLRKEGAEVVIPAGLSREEVDAQIAEFFA